MIKSYSTHVGRTQDRAKKCGSICTIPIDYITNIICSVAIDSDGFDLLSRMNKDARVIKYDFDLNEIEPLKNELKIINADKEVTESFLLACEYAMNHKMHLYLFKEK